VKMKEEKEAKDGKSGSEKNETGIGIGKIGKFTFF